MLVGEITLNTCYGDCVIPVEILGKGPRPATAWVRALNGLAPFTRISHGGPYQDDSAVWYIPMLRNVHVENDEDEAGETAPSLVEPPEPAPDEFLEMDYEDRTFSD